MPGASDGARQRSSMPVALSLAPAALCAVQIAMLASWPSATCEAKGQWPPVAAARRGGPGRLRSCSPSFFLFFSFLVSRSPRRLFVCC